MFNLHLLGAKSGPKVPARQNPSMVRPRYALHMPQLCPKHAQTMPKICPNLSVTNEILITRLMSPRRRDITVDREGPTVLRTNEQTVEGFSGA